MASAMKVNTDAVVTVAKNIKRINDDIRNQFSDVESAIRRLDSSWDGSAATNAIGKFNSLKGAYCDNRYKVIENFVNFLLQQVGEGYTQTESANTSLADAFK